MRQVFLQRGLVKVHEVETPVMNNKSIVVRVHYSFISSGTEAATISASGKTIFERASGNFSEKVNKVIGAIKENGLDGTISLIKEKLDCLMPLGYSCSGEVIAVGKDVSSFRVGDYVACAGAGIANHADLVVVPQNLAVKINSAYYLKQASLTTIGAIAMQGFRRTSLQIGEKVCVIGLGLIGQITVQLAKCAGCTVVGIDVLENRLRLAQKLGADSVLDATKDDIISAIYFATEHNGVDATIITAASQSGDIIQQAMNITRRKGKVTLVGDVKINFDREPFYSKEIDFLISCSYGPGRYDETYEKNGMDYPYPYVRWTENRNMALFAEFIQDKKIDIDPLIYHEFDISKAEEAYNCLKHNNSPLGIVLSYLPKTDKEKYFFEEQNKITDFALSDVAKTFVATEGITKVGIIGAGGFAKIKLLPIISKIKNVSIHSVVDINTTNAINIARLYDSFKALNDYQKFLCDDEVNVAIIATPHSLHADQAINAMKMGKAVFVEKPAAVNIDQLISLKNFFSINKNSIYCVDFNRSFSPFMLSIKDLVKNRHNPMIIHYRMNAGYLPKDHWIHAPENGGRIVGEACHIFELFCFLTDAFPVAVNVEILNSASEDIIPTDNFNVHIKMSGGSCCSLTYSSVGNNSMGKERLEIFFDGKSIVMDDFLELRGYGLPVSFNKRLQTQEKGHSNLLKAFFKTVRTPHAQPPIPIKRILIATELSLIVDKLARMGGGREILT